MTVVDDALARGREIQDTATVEADLRFYFNQTAHFRLQVEPPTSNSTSLGMVAYAVDKGWLSLDGTYSADGITQAEFRLTPAGVAALRA